MNQETVRQVLARVNSMELAAAERLIRESGLVCRLMSEDGIQFGGDARYMPNRINLEVIDGIVRDARAG